MDTTFAEYFSSYLGTDLTSANAGEIIVVGSPRRLQPENGWGYTVAAWLFRADDATVISAQPALVPAIQHALRERPTSVDAIAEAIAPALAGMNMRRHFVYTANADNLHHINSPNVRRMTMQDVDAFIDMSRAMWPEIDVECETSDITRNIDDGIAFGAFVNRRMVTRCYAPHIAHMQDRVEEIGVDTLEGYRNRGFAGAALAGCTRATLDVGRLPVYRVSVHNDVSIRLAERVGYQRVAESIEWIS